MADLMDQGDGDLVEQLILVAAHPGQGTTEQHHPVRERPEPGAVAFCQGDALVESQGVRPVLGLVLHHYRDIVQASQ